MGPPEGASVIEFEFAPPTKPWSTNEDRQLNRYARAERIALWKGVTQLEWVSQANRAGRPKAVVPSGSLVRVDVPFTTHRRRDPHNYCGTVLKAVIDGMVLAGAWPDDTHEYLEHLAPTLYVSKHGPVVVKVFPRRNAYIPCDHGNLRSCSKDGCEGPMVIEW